MLGNFEIVADFDLLDGSSFMIIKNVNYLYQLQWLVYVCVRWTLNSDGPYWLILISKIMRRPNIAGKHSNKYSQLLKAVSNEWNAMTKFYLLNWNSEFVSNQICDSNINGRKFRPKSVNG